MNMYKFIKEMNKLKNAYGFAIEENSDSWVHMDGFMLYRDIDTKKHFANIAGVQYTQDGSGLEGDFEGVLKLMKEAADKEFKLGEIT